MVMVFLSRRLLICGVALCVAATSLPLQGFSTCSSSEPARRCCCDGWGECRCGPVCACLVPLPIPATPESADKFDPRVTPELSAPDWTSMSERAASPLPGAMSSVWSGQQGFPSLRTLEVRIQT